MNHSKSSNISNLNSLFGQFTRVYNHVDINNGTLLFDHYMDPTELSPSTNDSPKGQPYDDFLAPLPHQEHPDDSSDSEPPNSKTNVDKTGNVTTTERQYEVPLSLRRPFRLPLKKGSTVITPQTKAAQLLNVLNKDQANTDCARKPTSPSPPRSPKSPTEGTNDEPKNPNNEGIKEASTAPNELDFSNNLTVKNLFNQVKHKIHLSPYLDKNFLPNKESLKLTPELEPLELLIMSQHEVLTQPIKDLGTINLNLTKILDKKKESLHTLQNDDKIPRSLRFKCELTSSPSYANHPDFLKLKAEFQQELNTFITNGTRIMSKWASINVKLLNVDRCTDILDKALQILDGLIFFYSNIFGTPIWPSVDDKFLTLFLFKFYISNDFFDVTELTQYLDLLIDEILLIGAKTLLKSNSEEEITKIIASLNLKDINMEEITDNAFITEILLNFDQIFKFTTTRLWNHHQEKAKQTTAAMKMKAKMKSLEITNATLATAQAIAKAANIQESTQRLHANNNLRISILEKSINKQEQKSNEIINIIKSKHQIKNIKNQKNSKGSHSPESMASPDHMTLKHKHTSKAILKRTLVDLTTEEMEEQEPEKINSPQLPPPKKTRQNQHKRGTLSNRSTHSKKTVHWQDKNTQKHSEPYSANENLARTVSLAPNIQPHQPPAFPQPPPPPPPLIPTPFPYQYYSHHNGMSPHYNQQIYPNQQIFQTQGYSSNRLLWQTLSSIHNKHNTKI